MVRVLHEQHAFSDVFVSFLLSRNARIQEDLVDQLFNSSKQGNTLLRFLLVEAAQAAARSDPQVAPAVRTPGPASRADDRQDRDCTQAGGQFVLDVAGRRQLRREERAQFARGTAWNSRWCQFASALMTRRPAPPYRGGVRSSNHDRSCDRRDGWVGLSSEPMDYSEPLGWSWRFFQRERNGALFGVHG